MIQLFQCPSCSAVLQATEATLTRELTPVRCGECYRNTHKLPEGIEVEIMHDDGVARESVGEYGRSVHFAHGTHYWISITNKTKKHAAFDLYIDGRKVNLTTILLYRGRRDPDGDIKSRPRVIKGYELTRDSVELTGDKFATEGTIERFVANRHKVGLMLPPPPTIGSARSSLSSSRDPVRKASAGEDATARRTTK